MKVAKYKLAKIPDGRKGRPGTNWLAIAEVMSRNPESAVFVKANGVTAQQIRNNARKSFDNYFTRSTLVHSKIQPDGVYFWIERNGREADRG